MKNFSFFYSLFFIFTCFIVVKAQETTKNDSLKLALINDFYAPKITLKKSETIFPVYAKNYQELMKQYAENEKRKKTENKWDDNRSVTSNIAYDIFTSFIRKAINPQ